MRTKPSTKRRRLSALALAAALMALPACGMGDDSNAGDSPKSPLKKYLGYSPFDTDNSGAMPSFAVAGGSAELTMTGSPVPLGAGGSQRKQGETRKVENLIATCMEKQGFDYVPYVPKNDDKKSPMEKAHDLPPEKFAKRWGYGIATMDEIDVMAGMDDDPNQKIYDKLPKSAQKAYDKALHGPGASGKSVVITDGKSLSDGQSAPDEGKREGKSKETTKEPSGCAEQAHRKVFGDPEADMEKMKSFDSLFEDVDALSKRLGRDPKVAEANAEWSDCMADAGHTGLDSPEQARKNIQKKLNKAFENDGDTDKLADKEISLATADHECAQKGLDEVRAEVAATLESEFVSDHKDELQRYRDYRTEQQGGKGAKSGNQGSGN